MLNKLVSIIRELNSNDNKNSELLDDNLDIYRLLHAEDLHDDNDDGDDDENSIHRFHQLVTSIATIKQSIEKIFQIYKSTREFFS